MILIRQMKLLHIYAICRAFLASKVAKELEAILRNEI